MKKSVVLLSMGLMAMAAGADTVNFTAAEGYTNPVALADYAGWSGSTGFVVNTSGTGTVDWSGPSSAMINYENGIVPAATNIEVSMQFRMTRTTGFGAGVAFRTVTALFLEMDAVGENALDDGSNDARVTLERLNTVTGYRIAFNNTTTGAPSAGKFNGNAFDQSLMGIEAVGDVSDLLELKMVLHRGESRTNWTSDVILNNVTSNSVISEILDHPFNSPESYFTSPLYGAISGSSADDDLLGITDRQIESFTLVGHGTAYDAWADDWDVNIGSETNDFDNDGVLNIHEYGLGGDPTNTLDRGIAPSFGMVDVGGTNYFNYVYPQLSNPYSGLSYHIELNTDLVSTPWTNTGYEIAGTNVTGGTLDFVTNVTDMVDSTKCIRLIIE